VLTSWRGDRADILAAWQSRLNRLKVERVYLVVALVWGLILVVLVPPFQTFDEVAHYYRAWSVAEGQLVVPPSGHVNLPATADALPDRFPYQPVVRGLEKIAVGDLLDELDAPMSSGTVESSSFASGYGFVGYLPQAAGITLARLTGGSPLLALYLARLLNLLVAVVLTYYGLRFLPFAKLAVCLVALLPMTMMELASLSADAMLLGGTIFLAGLVVSRAQQESVSRSDIALLVVAAVFLLNAKPGYAALSLLLLLLVRRQFTSRLAYAGTVFGSIAASALLALAFIRSAPPGDKDLLAVMLGPDNRVDAAAQLAHVVTHPLAFVQVIGATAGGDGVMFLRQAVAWYAWGNLDISDGVMLVGLAGLVAVFAASESVTFAAWRRWTVLAVGLLAGIMVSLALYMGWSDVGATRVAGLQGRYFTPTLILAFIGLAGFPFGRRWLVPAIVAVVVYILFMTNLRTLLFFYY
jgi:uncharacterized membrane protein